MVFKPENVPDYLESTIRAQIEDLKRTRLAIEGQIEQIEKNRTHDKSRERDAMFEVLLDEQKGMLLDTDTEIENLKTKLIDLLTSSGKISG